MSSLTATPPEAEATSAASADELRSQMYANREFMMNIRRGYDEGLRDEGIPVDRYFKERGIS